MSILEKKAGTSEDEDGKNSRRPEKAWFTGHNDEPFKKLIRTFKKRQKKKNRQKEQ